MAETKLNIRFHNPNLAEYTADFIFPILVASSKTKLENALKLAANEEQEYEIHKK